MAFGAVKGTLTVAANSITNPTSATTGGPITVAVGDLIYAVIAEQATATVTACADNLTNSYAARSGHASPMPARSVPSTSPARPAVIRSPQWWW